MKCAQAPIPAFVGIDWGTSSFRAWLMSASGDVIAQSKSGEGMLHCAKSGFAPVLERHLRKLGATKDLPVLICGMAGSRQGWVEAPYLPTPTTLDHLHQGAQRIECDMNVQILPGIAQKNVHNPDVMRGEETQILGAIDDSFTGLVCIPGTHSKWIKISNGIIQSFQTYMTGELFSLLSSQSILMHAVECDDNHIVDDAVFLSGFEIGLKSPTNLTTNLFRLRASQLLGFSQRKDGYHWLSGLLIGVELADALKDYHKDIPLILIGAGRLATLYDNAMQHSGYEPQIMDAEEASRKGLLKAARHLCNVKEQ